MPLLHLPIHDPDGRYMAQCIVNYSLQAIEAAAELKAIPEGYISQTKSLIETLVNGNCIAERVLRVTSNRQRGTPEPT